MILVDANILIYAASPNAAQHRKANSWLDGRLNGDDPVGLPWSSLLAFLRIMTNPRMASPPVAIADAWAQVSDWLALPCVWIPSPTDRHADVLSRLLASTSASGNLVPDAHLAALAIEHGLLLCSADSDFARFRGLRWVNPLAAEDPARR